MHSAVDGFSELAVAVAVAVAIAVTVVSSRRIEVL